MADISISSLSQKTQDYIEENKLDKNNDGKINQDNGELQVLLSGNPVEKKNFAIGKNAPKKMFDFYAANNAINYFSSLTQDERTSLVDKCKEAQEVKLEVLKNAISANYNSVRDAISDSVLIDFYTNKSDFVKMFRDIIENIADKFNEAQWNVAQNIDVYTGARAYVDECGLGSGYTDYSGYGNKITIKDAEQQVMKKLGYNSLEEFAAEFAKLNYDGSPKTDTKTVFENIQKQYDMLTKFANKLSEVYEPSIKAKEDEANSKYDEQYKINEYGKQQLDSIATEPPAEYEVDSYRNWIAAPIGFTFMQTILEYKKQQDATGVTQPKVEVNGKEYVVGQKYQEELPDGKKRIVTYDSAGNKWDVLRKCKVQD